LRQFSGNLSHFSGKTEWLKQMGLNPFQESQSKNAALAAENAALRAELNSARQAVASLSRRISQLEQRAADRDAWEKECVQRVKALEMRPR
jgi:hypothetical protein